MMLRFSTLFLRTLREDPAEAETQSHKLLLRAGYIRRAAPGIYTWLPLGLRVLKKVERVIHEEMQAIGAQEVHFPALLPKEPYELTGRWQEYGEGIFRLQDRKHNEYLLAPTHEEMFTLLVKDVLSSYKDLPVVLYQVQTKYRDELRPRAGLLRGREFIMKDSYSFDCDQQGLEASYQAHRQAYFRIFARLGLDVVAVQATAGAMGGSRSEEFLHPTPVGEDSFVYSEGGYAANVEAVVTEPPREIDCATFEEAHVCKTPQASTIDALIETMNADYPRPDRPWTAADTLKHVVVAVRLPGTARDAAEQQDVQEEREVSGIAERQLVVVALPGDRTIDLRRIEASLPALLGSPGEASVEMATANDFVRHPTLVQGYIGPGASLERPFLGREAQTRIPYFVDPRVVRGSRWIVGANSAEHHVVNLVAGRDFSWDGVLDATHIQPGDPAPDGSGPLQVGRGMEMGHIFQLGRRYAEVLGLKVLDRQGKQSVVTMGSYGIGVTRALGAIAEQNRDDKGLLWPMALAPAHVHILVLGRGEELFEAGERLGRELEACNLEVMIDDRRKVSPGVKFSDAELIGIPLLLTVGRDWAAGQAEVTERKSGVSVKLTHENIVTYCRGLVEQALTNE